jgi:microcystin-dependent protein
MNGAMIAFTPHATNGATATLNVDSLGAKPLRTSPGVELQSNVLIAGTPYCATYNSSDAVWYLHGFFGNPYNVPLGAGMDYWGATAPNSAFAFPAGQLLSRATYAALFTLIGTTYGAGDGSTNFALPDKTGRASVMKEASAIRLTTAGSGVDGATLGAVGGVQNVTLATNQIPSLTSVNASQSINVLSSQTGIPSGANTGAALTNGGGPYYGPGNSSVPLAVSQINSSGNNSISVTYANGSQVATKTVQPTIVCNYIIRII